MSRNIALVCLGLASLLFVAAAAPWMRAAAAGMVTVIQAHRAFSVAELRVRRGDAVHFTNDDAFNHQIFVKSPAFSYESKEQAPGEAVDLRFPVGGTFDVQCEIHPRMHLAVTVD